MEKMETSQDTERLAENRSSDNSNCLLIIVVAVIILVIAVVALIIALVSITQNGGPRIVYLGASSGQIGTGGSGRYDDDSDRVWQLAFEHIGRTAYIDDATGELRGFHVDLTSAVCQIAGKNCQTVYDTPQRCWDSQTGSRAQGGVGLMAGYYDACVGWIQTYERPRTFKFTDSYTVPIVAAFIAKKDNTDFNWKDLTNSKIGIIDGWAYDEHCIARESDRITGADLSTDQIMHYSPGREQLFDGLMNGEVDAVFDYKNSWIGLSPETKVASDDITSCFVGAAGLMLRKDNGLDTWWNPALATLMATDSQWRAICNDISDEHGHIDGPEPEDVCANYNP